MPRFIDEKVVMSIIENYEKTVDKQGKVVVNAIKDIISIICPSADVAPVRHARWKGAGMGEYYCSLCCGTVSGNDHKFCEHCGAKMDCRE